MRWIFLLFLISICFPVSSTTVRAEAVTAARPLAVAGQEHHAIPVRYGECGYDYPCQALRRRRYERPRAVVITGTRDIYIRNNYGNIYAERVRRSEPRPRPGCGRDIECGERVMRERLVGEGPCGEVVIERKRVYPPCNCGNYPCNGNCGPGCWRDRIKAGYCGHGCDFYRENPRAEKEVEARPHRDDDDLMERVERLEREVKARRGEEGRGRNAVREDSDDDGPRVPYKSPKYPL